MNKFNLIENLPNDLIYYILDLSLLKNNMFELILKNVNKFFFDIIKNFVFNNNHSDVCLIDRSDPYFNKHINFFRKKNKNRMDYFTELYINPKLVYYYNDLKKLDINLNLIKILILNNDQKWLNEIFNNYEIDYMLDNVCFSLAAKQNDIKLLKLLKNHRCPYDEKVYIEAAKFNNLDIIVWLNKNNFPMSEGLFYEAINCGNINIIKYLDLFRCPYSYWIFNVTFKNNNFDIIKLIYQLKKPVFNDVNFFYPIYLKNYQVINWLLENNCPKLDFGLSICAKKNDKKLAEYLYSKGFKFCKNCFNTAVRFCNYDLVVWYYDKINADNMANINIYKNYNYKKMLYNSLEYCKKNNNQEYKKIRKFVDKVICKF